MENSLISWCDHTQNFWIGCTHVSPGCFMCYAYTLDLNRFSKTLDGGTKEAPVSHWGPGAPRHRTSIHTWNEPKRWNRIAKAGFFAEVTRAGKFIARGDMRRLVKIKDDDGVHLIQEGDRVVKVRPRVFCSSLADLLDPEVDPKMLAEALDVIRQCDGIDWLLLTKRPELWRQRLDQAYNYCTQQVRDYNPDLQLWILTWLQGEAPAHIWFGCTMEDQPRWNLRIEHLCKIPAAVRFVSMEPMIGPVNMFLGANLPSERALRWYRPVGNMIDLVICGGESGDDVKDETGKVIRSPRPMHPDWARSIRDQCRKAGVAFHFKQWGEWREAALTIEEEEASIWVTPGGTVYQDVVEIPDEVLGSAMVIRVGKKAAGRLLDGVEHNAFPIGPLGPCPNDTDGDGDCHLCHPKGCQMRKELAR